MRTLHSTLDDLTRNSDLESRVHHQKETKYKPYAVRIHLVLQHEITPRAKRVETQIHRDPNKKP